MRLRLKTGAGVRGPRWRLVPRVSRRGKEVLSVQEGRGHEEVGEASDGGQAGPSLSLSVSAPDTLHISSLTVPMSSGLGLQVVFTPTTRWQNQAPTGE